MEINIKQASEKDINVILLMMEKLYLELGKEKESVKFLDKNLIKEILESGKTLILQALTDTSEPCGMITLTESQAIYAGGKYGVIDEIYVSKKYRSLNIGKKLIKKAREIALEKNWKQLNVTAPAGNNERALKFYESNGFTFTGPKLKLKIEKLSYMEKILKTE